MSRLERICCMVLVGVLWSTTFITVVGAKPPKKRRMRQTVVTQMKHGCTPDPTNLLLTWAPAKNNGTITFWYDMSSFPGDGPNSWWQNIQVYVQTGTYLNPVWTPYTTLYTPMQLGCGSSMGFMMTLPNINRAGLGQTMAAAGSITYGDNVDDGGVILAITKLQFQTPIDAVRQLDE